MSCEDEHFGVGRAGGGGNGDGHGHGHGHGHDHSHVAPIPTYESQLLLTKIDIPHITGLNIANPVEEVQKLFRSHREKYLLQPVIKSDCDAQLILNIPFMNSCVKLHSMILRTNGDLYCPKTIKLWKNDRGIDFDCVGSKKPTFVVTHPHTGVGYNLGEDMPEVLESDNDFVEHFLPRHIFTGVHHLTIFVEDIYNGDEEDETHLHYIELRGEYTDLTKDPVITVYELAANPADHQNIVASEGANYSIGS